MTQNVTPDSLRGKYKRARFTMAGSAISAAALMLTQVSGLPGGPPDTLLVDMLALVFSVAMVVMLVLALIFYLIWVFHFHSGLQQLDLSYPIGPKGAIARFLIPGYNLWGVWNVHSTYAERLARSTDLESRTRGFRIRTLLPFYYGALLCGSILDRVSGQKNIPKSTANWLDPLGVLLTVAWLSLWLVMTSMMEQTLSRDLSDHVQIQTTQE